LERRSQRLLILTDSFYITDSPDSPDFHYIYYII
jgi:hypothetical protein